MGSSSLYLFILLLKIFPNLPYVFQQFNRLYAEIERELYLLHMKERKHKINKVFLLKVSPTTYLKIKDMSDRTGIVFARIEWLKA